MNKQIPKYVQQLLDRRNRLAWALMKVGSQIDKYCEKIGIIDLDSAALCSNVMIYAEPDVAQAVTEQAILDALNISNRV